MSASPITHSTESRVGEESPPPRIAERVRRSYDGLESIRSAQVAYLAEKVRSIGVECTTEVDRLKRRLEELEGNAACMVSVSAFAKMKNLPVRFVRNLIAEGKLSGLPVGRGRYKLDVAGANRELRALMIRSSVWRLAHEETERRRVDFAA